MSSATSTAAPSSATSGIFSLVGSEFGSLKRPKSLVREEADKYDSEDNEMELRRLLGPDGSCELSTQHPDAEAPSAEDLSYILAPMDKFADHCPTNSRMQKVVVGGRCHGGCIEMVTQRIFMHVGRAKQCQSQDCEKLEALESGVLDSSGIAPRTNSDKPRELIPSVFLRKCLVHSRGDVALAAKIVRKLVEFRSAQVWPIRIPRSSVESVLTSGMHWLLPRREVKDVVTPLYGGCLVYNVTRLEVSSDAPMSLYQKMGSYLVERATDSRECQLHGICLILDCQGFGYSSLAYLLATFSTGPEDLQRGVMMWRRAFPVRVTRIFVVDPPWGCGTLIANVLSAGSPELKEIVKLAYRSEIPVEKAEDLAATDQEDFSMSCLISELGHLFVLPEGLGGIPGEFSWDDLVNGEWLQ